MDSQDKVRVITASVKLKRGDGGSRHSRIDVVEKFTAGPLINRLFRSADARKLY
jgi:hypothetical protein